jgi:3-methylfumaryl-CoA hydratase
MTMATVDIDHLRKWVGREQTVDDPLTLFPARALGAALDHGSLLSSGDALPPSWHWLYFLETPQRSVTGVDGHPKKGEFLPPIELPRRMWAGGSLKISEVLRLGTPARKRSTIRSIDFKTGKSGDLVFLVLDHEIHQDGTLCIQEEQTLVYRAITAGKAPLPPGNPAASAPDWSSTFEPDPIALFRFSALTYNAHRIHYDRAYATGQEFYPGLVVHAPLLVTLVLDLLAREAATFSLSALRFRAIRPTFDLAPVQLCGKRDGPHINLWTADADNFVGLSAVAATGSLA